MRPRPPSVGWFGRRRPECLSSSSRIATFRFRNGIYSRVEIVSAADLAFTGDELRALFAQEDVSLSDENVETLTRWTAGSPSAVALAAAAWRDARDRETIIASALRADTSAHVVLFDRLLERLPRDRRAVITSSSIVEFVSGDAVAAISGHDDATRALDELAQSDVYFDAIPDCPGWYRHRHPSRELLQAALVYAGRGDVESYHARAARWFAELGLSGWALESAVKGNEWGIVTDIVRTRWTATAFDELDADLAEVPAVPEQLAAGDVDIALAAAAIDIEHGEHERAAERLGRLGDMPAPASGRSSESHLFEALLRLRLARDAASSPEIEAACEALRGLVRRECGTFRLGSPTRDRSWHWRWPRRA